jgi:tetratricopeptide (TPR) repeat protein
MKPAFLLLSIAALAVAQVPSQKRDLVVERIEKEAAPAKTDIPLSYAVVIGISKYKNLSQEQQLRFAERDAQAIHTVLASVEGGNFKAENVHTLLNEKATLASIRHEIDEWLPSKAKPDDRVLIYFAGHGLIRGGKGYLAPFDVDPGDVAHTAYAMDELGLMAASKIGAKYKILLTDACHSGKITPDDSQAVTSKLRSLDESLFSLTASRDREQSYESADLEGGHGFFTYYLVEGLRGAADADHDGVVTADELAEYVRREVRAKVHEASKGQYEQTPTSDRGSWDPKMFLSLVAGGVAPAAPPRADTGTLVFTANMDDVELFVDGVSKGVLKKGQRFDVPGLQPGEHIVKGVHMGYEPDGPRPEMVYPGQESTVSIKIMIQRRRNPGAAKLLDQGIEYYQKGGADNYKKAAALFEQALRADSTYSEAAFFLGSTYNALYDEEKAGQYFQKAIAIDPDYLEARAAYAGMLLDTGEVDEALRQIDAVLQRQPQHELALTMRAQAYRFKGLYAECIEAARQASKLAPKKAEPHLWMGDGLRFLSKWPDARAEYVEYLKLSDFDSRLAGKLNYFVIGSLIGMGKKKRASQHDIWSDLRSLAYFGICDCDERTGQFESAIRYCQKALAYDSRDPYAHLVLGKALEHKAIEEGSVPGLDPALRHFELALQINPDLAEAPIARDNINKIRKYLADH